MLHCRCSNEYCKPSLSRLLNNGFIPNAALNKCVANLNRAIERCSAAYECNVEMPEEMLSYRLGDSHLEPVKDIDSLMDLL